MLKKEEIIKELMQSARVTELVDKWDLSSEQIEEALPILIDIAYEKDDDNTKFLTSLKVHRGNVQRIQIRSTYQEQFAYRDNIVTLDIENVNFEDSKEFIREAGGRREIIQFASTLLNGEATNNKGLYIHGDMGIGKTFILKRLAKKFATSGKKVGFVTVTNLYQKAIDAISNYGRKAQLVDALKGVDYLFLDDIGAEQVSSWFRDDVLFNILNHRMNHGLTTFFSSNYSIQKLTDAESRTVKQSFRDWDKAKRLVNRIEALAVVKLLSGTNKRV